MKSNWFPLFFLGVLMEASALFAVDGTWTSVNGGTWSVTNNWQGGIVATGAASTAYITANISVARAVTNDGPRTIGSLEFSDGGANSYGWTLAGSSALTLSAGGAPEIRWQTPVDQLAPLDGTEPLLLKGYSGAINSPGDANASGVLPPLALKGANTFSGDVTLRRGKVLLAASVLPGVNGPLGNASSAIRLGDSGMATTDHALLQLSLANGTFGRDVTVGDNGAIIGIGDNVSGTGDNTTWSGNLQLARDIWIFGRGNVRWVGRISGPGGIVKTDINSAAGTLYLSASNDFSGPVTISRGTISLAHPQGFGTGTSAIRVGDSNTTAGVTLYLTNGIMLERDVEVSGDGVGTPTIGMLAANYVCGLKGTLTLGRTASFLPIGSGKFFLSGYVTGTGGVSCVAGNTSSQLLLLCPTNDFTGSVTIGKGVLIISNEVLKAQPGPLGQSASAIRLGGTVGDIPSLNVNANGLFERDVISSNATSPVINTSTATNLVFSGSLLQSVTQLIISPVNATNLIEWLGPISGGGAIQKDGAGVLVLSGANSGWTGGLTLINGTVKLNSPTALGSGGWVTFYTGSGESIQNTSDSPIIAPLGVIYRRKAILSGPGDLILTGPITNASDPSASWPIQVDQTNALFGLRGNLVGDKILSFVKSGPGFLEWGATNLSAVFTNVIDIQAGVLRATPDPSILATNALYLNGGVFESRGSLSRTLGKLPGQLYFRNAAGYPGGFSAYGGNLTVDLNGAGPNTLTWGAGDFVAPALLFGSVRADSETILVDGIELGSAARTIRTIDNTNSLSDKATIQGPITSTSASGQLYVEGSGVLALAGTNTFVAPSYVTNATLLVDGEMATAAGTITMRANSRLGGRGTINRPLSLLAGFGGFDWADEPGTLSINASLALPASFTYHYRHSGAQVPLVHVTGTLTVSNSVTVNVYGETKPLLTLFTAGALAGTQNLTNWVVTGSSKPYAVKVQGLAIVAVYSASGTLISIR